MHKSSVQFGKKNRRFGSGSAKNSWFSRFLVWTLVQEFRFFIYQVFASKDMEFFSKTEVA